MSLADEIVGMLTQVNRYIDEKNRMVFYFANVEDAFMVKGLLNQWYFDRGGYGPWTKDGDHWDHKHRDGIVFHHPTKACEELS